jgi:hypothetical protein
VVRRRSAKPLFSGSNPDAASKKNLGVRQVRLIPFFINSHLILDMKLPFFYIGLTQKRVHITYHGQSKKSEMANPQNSHVIELLAALSRQSNFSIGCYYGNEVHCHHSVLSELLVGSCTNTGAPESEPDFGFFLRDRSGHSQARL